MMEGFIDQIEEEGIASQLDEAIRERGAFRRFKDLAHELNVIDDWYDYRNQRFRAVAMDWCEAHGIAWS